MAQGKVYRLQEGVQVRREVFGLLFYDYRGPRLYFVPSGDLIDDAFFTGRQSEEELIEALAVQFCWSKPAVQDRVQQILQLLEGKGLVHGQPLC
jgi:putative mycofactocin binding protein MftB